MNQSRENRQYERWNLVATGEILCRRFFDASIAIIRPNEMKDGIFSRFDSFIHSSLRNSIVRLIRFSNFLPSTTEYGDPISYDTTDLIGLQQLRALDEQLSQQTTFVLLKKHSSSYFRSFGFSSSTSEITLVGFSKGCVVLNQLLEELTALRLAKGPVDLSKFASRIRRFIWLDGGHNNGEHAMIWPTDDNLLNTLLDNQIDIEIYVTPFQINSSNPYKIHHTKQYGKFLELLQTRLANVRNYRNEMFFANERASIEKHFELLTVF